MKIFFCACVIMVFFLIGCSCNSKNPEIKFEPIENLGSVESKSPDPLEALRLFRDSANNFQKGDSLPSFAYDPYIDYIYPWIGAGAHRTLSIREMIFDSIVNVAFLEVMINSADVRVREIPDSNLVEDKSLFRSLINTDKSNYDFAKERYKKLKTSN